MQNEADETKWTIAYLDVKDENEITNKANSTDQLSKKWKHFEQDVTSNPYFHSKAKRIAKLKDNTIFPKGSWRYRHDPLRVVYYPEGETKTIYPLEVASATDISYKKKSSK